jgi:predicted membrane-bound mannosyltransferase
MREGLSSFKNSALNKALFSVSIITILYWWIAKSLNVYNYAFLGAIFELLWLVMIAAVFIGPVFSILLFLRDKYNPRSLVLYSFLCQIIALCILLFFNN